MTTSDMWITCRCGNAQFLLLLPGKSQVPQCTFTESILDTAYVARCSVGDTHSFGPWEFHIYLGK